MKKRFLFLAGSVILFASCGSNESANNAPSQAQIDSAANAAAAAKEAELKAKNDSLIAAEAKAKADSMEAARIAAEAKAGTKKSSGSGSTKKNDKTPPPTTPKETTVQPANPKDARFNQSTQQQVDKAAHDKKAERFK